MRPLLFFFAAPLSFFLFTGCSPEAFETDEKQYRLAKSYQTQGRNEEALSAYLRVIEGRRTAPESHFEAGHIYLTDIKDPVSAIYHFRRHLELKPDSEQTERVRQLIETARKEFARQLPVRPYEGQLDRLDLMELIEGLKVENEKLKRNLLTAQSRVRQLERLIANKPDSETSEKSVALPSPASRAKISSARSAASLRYTVRSGDTLSRISVKVYGAPSRWSDIYQANRDRLSSENALRVGQELRIP